MSRIQGIHIIEQDDSQIGLPNDSHQTISENQAMEHRLAKWRITPRQSAVIGLPLASIAPPATLSVGLSNSTLTTQVSMPNFNWTARWLLERKSHTTVWNDSQPTSIVHLYTKRAAYRGTILASSAPPPNPTFQYSFHGPSISCRHSTENEAPEFAFIAQELYKNQDLTVEEPKCTSLDPATEDRLLIYAAFPPTLDKHMLGDKR
ncbi:unnamed protein product [Fusarium graminearum]|nr:unnamed protein product [Fusarium graminearum]